MAQLNFDATQVKPNDGGFEAIPAGWYNAYITESELKATKDKTGAYLELKFKVMDGQYKDSVVISRLNISNANEQAQKIGIGQLSSVCHALNMGFVQDSVQLHNQPMKIRVKYIAAKGEYEASNDITSYKNINYQAPQSPDNTAIPSVAAPVIPAINTQVAQPWAQQTQTAPIVPQMQQPAQQAPIQQPIQQAPQMPVQQPAEMPVWAQQSAPQAQQVQPQAQQTAQQGPNDVLPPWMQQPQ